MKHFELRPGFLVGHRQIDTEHAELVALLNACIDIANAGGDRAAFIAKFCEFEDAIRQHIIDEEIIMAELGYRDTDADAGVHQETTSIFHELVDDCKRNVDTDTILKQAVAALLEKMLKADLGLKGHLHKIGYQDA
ncbi:bacteriohemerythrin [Pseudomonadota bacterium]